MVSPNASVSALDVELRCWAGLSRPPASDDSVIYIHKDADFLVRLDETLARIRPRRRLVGPAIVLGAALPRREELRRREPGVGAGLIPAREG